ncbi:MAG TPA: hypothetical protein VHG33_00640 [Woeseiaceae bacterium]|nr:hypothetical protein [Woeseiaceae bacterium]
MKKHPFLPMLLLTSACASDPQGEGPVADREYRRDVAHIESAEAFEKKKAACARSGGAVVVRRTFSRRMRGSTPEMDLATCLPGPSGIF